MAKELSSGAREHAFLGHIYYGRCPKTSLVCDKLVELNEVRVELGFDNSSDTGAIQNPEQRRIIELGDMTLAPDTTCNIGRCALAEVDVRSYVLKGPSRPLTPGYL